MDKNHDTIAFAVSLIFKAVVIAAQFSGRVRKRSLKRLAAMDVGTKDKEILFLKDKIYQLEMQVSILQKRIQKRQKKPRYHWKVPMPAGSIMLWKVPLKNMAHPNILSQIRGVYLSERFLQSFWQLMKYCIVLEP